MLHASDINPALSAATDRSTRPAAGRVDAQCVLGMRVVVKGHSFIGAGLNWQHRYQKSKPE